MDGKTNRNLAFRLDDGQEINIEAFLLELHTDETFEGSGPDLTIQRHLKKVELLSEVRDPHLIFSDEYDGTVLPPLSNSFSKTRSFRRMLIPVSLFIGAKRR